MERNFEELKNNHLAHLQNDLDELRDDCKNIKDWQGKLLLALIPAGLAFLGLIVSLIIVLVKL